MEFMILTFFVADDSDEAVISSGVFNWWNWILAKNGKFIIYASKYIQKRNKLGSKYAYVAPKHICR